MNVLIKYDAARYALQQAVAVDEVKDIRDKAQAMSAYAKQAKDTELVEWATEIKVRAERRAGQMLAEMPKNKGAATRSHDVTASVKTLDEIGISKTQSSRWQKLAAVPDEQFEQAVSAAKEVAGEVTTAAMLRIERANNPVTVSTQQGKHKVAQPEPEAIAHPPPEEPPSEYSETDALNDQIEDLQNIIAAGFSAPTEADRVGAQELIDDMRKEIKTLRATLAATESQRDILMTENASIKRQCLSQARKLKKYEGGGNVK